MLKQIRLPYTDTVNRTPQNAILFYDAQNVNLTLYDATSTSIPYIRKESNLILS